MRPSRSHLLLLLCATSAVGCASSRPSTFQPFVGQFPSREELSRLEQVPPAAIPVDSNTVRVDHHEPAVNRPETPHAMAAYEESWAEPLIGAVTAGQGRVYASHGMRCLAEELGRFYLAHQASPSEALGQHLAAHCGVDDPRPAAYFISGELGSGRTAEQAASEWRSDIERYIEDNLVGGMVHAGLWFGEVEGRAAYAVLSSKRRALLSEIETQGDRLKVSGQALNDYARIRGMTTRGPYGFEHCIPNPMVKLPRFELSCRIDPADPEVWLEIAGYQAGRFLGDALVVHRREGPGFDAAYHAPTPGEADAADYEQGVVAAVNAMRAAAGLEPLVFEAAQSQTNRTAAPHYFAGALGQDTILATDWIAMGLMAGWDVAGPIARGLISSRWQNQGVDPRSFVEWLARLPISRETLLNPRAARIAVGSLTLAEHLAVLITTYELFDETDRSELAARVLERLNRLRQDAGQPPVKTNPTATEEAVRAAQGVEDPQVNPETAISAGLNAVVTRTRGGVMSWVLPATELDELEFPPELLDASTASLGLAVTFFRASESPWGMYYVILYVMAGDTQV